MYSWTLKLLTFPPKNRVSVFLVKSQRHGEAWEGGFSFHAEMLRGMMWGVMMYDVGCYDGTGAYGQSLSCVRRVRASVRTNRASLLVNKVESGACCFACFSNLSRNQKGLCSNVGSLGSRLFCISVAEQLWSRMKIVVLLLLLLLSNNKWCICVG